MLAPYSAYGIGPGMGVAAYTAEHDNMGMIYGSPHHTVFLTHAIIDGAARDANNTDTTVLRPGLIMAKLSATQKWVPFVTGGSDGSEQPAGILTMLGLNTQMDGGNVDRFLATIMVGGNVNPAALVLSASATYGIPTSGAGLVVRKAFKYSFRFSDDFMGYIHSPLSGR